MHRFNCCFLVLGVAACAIVLSGCTDGGNTVKTEYVEGVLTVDGETIAEADVTFAPVTQGQGMSAAGRTDANGVYKLTAMGAEAKGSPQGGTLPGDYYVGVIKTVSDTPLSAEEAEAQGVEFVEPEPGVEPEMTYVVPQKYNIPKDSGIKVTVAKGKNDIPLKLVSE